MTTVEEIERKLFEAEKEKARAEEKWRLLDGIAAAKKALDEQDLDAKRGSNELRRLVAVSSKASVLDGSRESEIQGDIARRRGELLERIAGLRRDAAKSHLEVNRLEHEYDALLVVAPIPGACKIGKHVEDRGRARCIHCGKCIYHSPTLGDPYGESDPCFIATAAYGTAMDGRIDVLRQYRDTYLPSAVTKFYYQHSPSLARWLAGHDWARWLVRAMLAPLVELVRRVG